MTILKAIILGIVQGATEFLPVSSSGHLVIAQSYMNIATNNLEFDIVLHLGTLVAVFLVFYRSIFNLIYHFFHMILDLFKGNGPQFEKSRYRKYSLYIIVATIPAAVIGILYEEQIETLFSSIIIVAITLIVTGILLVIGERMGKNNDTPIEKLGTSASIFIGLFQSLAIIPGISRSGSTIVGGLIGGLKKEEAVEFSFILSIPAILGSLVLKGKEIFELGTSSSFWPLIFGFIAALIVGFFAIKLLIALVKKGKMYFFAIYCWLLSSFLLLDFFVF